MVASQSVVAIALLLNAAVDALDIKVGEQSWVQLRRTNALASADHAKHTEGIDLQHSRGDDSKNVTYVMVASRKRITAIEKGLKPKTLRNFKTKKAMMLAQPTGGPSKKMTAAEMTGVSANAAGDLDAFLSALVVNTVLIVVFFLIASILRRRYPNVYSWNSEKGPEDDPKRWDKYCDRETDPAFFGWWTMSASVTINDVVAKRGLDIGMLLQFCEDAKYILLCIALPLLLFVSPQHAFLGGDRAKNDYLSYLGMANVVDGHPFLYWEHAFFTWFVVVFVERQIFSCFRNFKTKRMEWLKAMPTPRSTTVIVENIPSDDKRNLRNETNLTEYMNKIFNREDAVKKVNVIKDTTQLLKKIATRNAEKDLYDEAAHKLELMKKAEPATDSAILKAQEEKKEQSVTKLRQILKEIDAAREEVLQDAKQGNSNVNLSVAFVTFYSRRDAELAKQMIFTSHADEFEVDVPPEPSDVIYADLQSDPRAQQLRDLLGYGLIAGVFWAYVPTVVGITYYASIETLAKHFQIFKEGAANPEFAALWDGIVGSQVLTQVMGFVPTFFVLIFSNLFILKAKAWLQYRVQFWYFYFQVTFILLVTTLGNSLSGLLHDIGENPGSVFYLLASSLPQASHFYLNYLPAQWVSHATNLMRIANLFKYKTWSLVYGEDKGKEKSEPEDQDYYGIGSRSARFSFMFVLSLTFCLLSPLMAALGWVNFWICRKVYGYLCVYAEIKKPDLGGVFYMSMLRHVQEAMFIFTVLMSGVLTMRDNSWWPGAIAGSALCFQIYYYKKFVLSLRWESLSFDEMVDYDQDDKIREDVDYVQPELREQDHNEFLPNTR